MKCAFCGKELTTTDKRVKYCSKECRHQAYLKQLKTSNKRRRATDPDYLEKTYEGNRQRYHARKHQRYVELAEILVETCETVEQTTEFLENNFRLRH